MKPIRPFTRGVVFLAMLSAAATLAQAAGSDSTATKNSAAKEEDLIAKLRSDAPAAEKAITCKFLAVYGSREAVGDLAKLLTDEHLASWSRIALEAIPGPEADAALRDALGSLKGRLLVGTINSIGVRRDQQAVGPLTAQLQGSDPDAASAAAVALGRIGNADATKTLRSSLAAAPAKVRNAVAEGCILCAERLMAEGKTNDAVEIYEEVRKAEVPKQKILEATRGAILARKVDGIPLLIEQLRSPDKPLFQIGLMTARELSGRAVGDALVKEAAGASPDRAALLLVAFADRNDAAATPAVLAIAKGGPKEVRIAAIGIVGRLGDASSLSTLLDIATDNDAELAQAAKAALAALPGDSINADIVARLAKADGTMLPVLLELVGQRRIDATEPLVGALGHPDAAARGAALMALGATVGPDKLSLLISQVVSPKNPADATVAQKALCAACVRMPDREVCASQLSAALAKAPQSAKGELLEILGEVGGANALATIGAAVKGSDPELQDTGSRLLGEWMTIDAAPVLLDLAKTAPSDKYQVRALRGYIRLARQFVMPDAERAEMCQKALGASERAAEQQLVLPVLQRYPSPEALDVAMQARKCPRSRTRPRA